MFATMFGNKMIGSGTVMMATGVGTVPGAAVTFTGGVVVGAGTAAWAIGKVIAVPIEADLRKMSNNIYMMQSESGVPENELADESSGKISNSGNVNSNKEKELLGKDGKFKDKNLEKDYQAYVKRNTSQKKKVRDRLNWKEESDYWKYQSPVARGNKFNEAVRDERTYNCD